MESLYVVSNIISPKNRYCNENLLIMAIHNVKMIVMPPLDPLESMRINKTISRREILRVKVLYKSKGFLLMIIIINLVLEKSQKIIKSKMNVLQCVG